MVTRAGTYLSKPERNIRKFQGFPWRVSSGWQGRAPAEGFCQLGGDPGETIRSGGTRGEPGGRLWWSSH